MTHKTRLRFLLAALILLMGIFVINHVPASQAAVQETCDECNARCEALGQSCRDQGFPNNVCIQCSTDCLYGVCSQ